MTAVHAADPAQSRSTLAPVVPLRQLMAADAAFTAAAGLGLLVGASPLAEAAGLATAGPARTVGLFFIALAVVVATVSRAPQRGLVRLATLNGIGDLLWAGASVLVALTADLSGSGRGMVLLQAAVVLAVGEAKLLLSRRVARPTG